MRKLRYLNHRIAAVAIIVSMLLTIYFILNLGPWSMFAFAFGAVPILFGTILFYYLPEVIQEFRSKDLL